MRIASRPQQVTLYSFVGNLGCIRFPPPIRKVSGIKRGDRLAVIVSGPDSLVLEKLEIPDWVPTDAIRVDECACPKAPEGCSKGRPDVVTVGWSYVKLSEELAVKLKFLPNIPLKLVGEADRITVSLHGDLRDLRGIQKVVCPP